VLYRYEAHQRIGKIYGVSAFTSTQSSVNEYSEVHAMTLTSSKAHKFFMPVLAKIPKSLARFGHPLTEVVFMDNVHADEHDLEKIFPWLRKDIVPVPMHSVLELLTFPPGWSMIFLSSTDQVNMHMNIIMNHYTKDQPVVVCFDLKFPVDAATGVCGLVAMIQIAYQKMVYLIQV
jgi:hypothetical protein